jgi:tRNA dimethylallyltransferase
MIPIIVIEGATASGKTSLALILAERFNTEIISADSRQVYKYLNIGTAKPSKLELKTTKHHLIDIINPDDSYNAGLFSKGAASIISRLNEHNKIPIVCGGTGLYVKALLEGLFKADSHDMVIRNDLEQKLLEFGTESLYDNLVEVDKTTADNLSKNDKQRILRALEVYYTTGITLSEHWSKQDRKSQFLPFRILLDEERSALYKRIDSRILAMINAGLIEEIEGILLKGFKWTDPGFNSLGYKEFRPCFESSVKLEECSKLAQQHSRNYAKRQVTWYRKYSFNLAGPLSSISISNVEELIKLHFHRNIPEE